jgi:uncharacterized protein YjbI with pentapeptide repeats
MNKIITIVILWILCTTTVLAQQKNVPTVRKCPINLTKQEQNAIAKNLNFFIATLKKQTDMIASPDKIFDLRCTDLSNFNLANRHLKYFNLSGANLDGVNAINAKLEYIDLSQASLRNIRANRLQLWDVNLDNTLLDNANFSSGQVLGKAKPISARQASFKNVNANGASMFFNIDARGANFDNARLDTCSFENITIDKNSSFKNTSFVLAILKNIQGAPGNPLRTDTNLKQFLLAQGTLLNSASIDGLDTDIPLKI